MTVHPTVANNAIIAFVSGGGSAVGSTVKPTILTANDTLAVGISSHFMTTIPYAAKDLMNTSQGGQSVMGRIVGGGVRIKCIGNMLHRQGVNYVSVSPTHENYSLMMSNGGDASGTSGVYTRAYTPNEEIFIPFGPNTIDECQYTGNLDFINNANNLSSYPFSHADITLTAGGFSMTSGYNVGTPSTSSTFVGCAPIYIWFTGAQNSNSVTYEWEIVQHIEYSGLVADSLGQPVESDIAGVSRVQSAVSQAFNASLGNAGSKKQSFTKIALNYLKELAIEAAPIVIGTLAKSLPALLL